MVHAGAVRFDHCVSLLRLWWIPKGESAHHGAYVHYDIDEFTGLLALESHRNQCMMVGEDLGTVPDELPKIMEDNAIYCYRVLYFEFEGDRMVPPESYPNHALATLNTHDVAPLVSWWQGSDIALRRELGVINDADQVSILKQQRNHHKQLVLNAMHHYGYLDDYKIVDQVPEMTPQLNTAIHSYLASSNAAMMLSQLEDWMDMQSPVNVPGTFREYKNWQRKLSQSIEGFFVSSENQQRLATINRIRGKAS
jgi:4-alpha-glucanotransferase